MTRLASLSNRIFLATSLLAVLSLGFAMAVVNGRATSAAESELARGLHEAGALVDEQRAQWSDFQARLTRIVADLPKLKAAVATDDAATVQPIAADYLAQARADLFAVTGRSGQLLASAGRSLPTRDAGFGGAVASALAGREQTRFWPLDDGLLQTVTVPITIGTSPPEVLGALTAGLVLDRKLAVRLREITESDVAFVMQGRLLASSLAGEGAEALGGLLASPGLGRVRLGREDYAAAVRPLAGSDGAASIVVLRSRTERLRFLEAIHASLAATMIAVVLLAIVTSYAVARTITRPLGAITGAMREMAATGTLGHPIALPAGRLVDEDARLLASTFNALTESAARFQREAARRDRLAALGRLSTVIAHEIRNPLMIIKASLRALGKEAPSPGEVREVAADIAGEVIRLGRVVDGVLDFARPIRFTLAQADLHEICREAVASLAPAAEPVPIAARLAAPDPALVTDAERLRLALVNLLGNARDAVLASRASGRADAPDSAPVVIETAGAGGQLEVRVRDRGAGIAPADLARVFEPFFTTRRTGTGLGLAITRNIVEGLGGRIDIRSEPDAGTEICLTLPREPRPAEGA